MYIVSHNQTATIYLILIRLELIRSIILLTCSMSLSVVAGKKKHRKPSK